MFPSPSSATPSTPSHYKALKPTCLFTSSPNGEEETTVSSLEASPPTTQKEDITLVCDIEHLQEDKDDETCVPTQYKTKAAMLISKIVKQNLALQEFDILRNGLKAKKRNKEKPTPSEQELYELLLARLHTAVISSKYVLKQETKKFEQEYYKEHGVLPREDEYSHLQKPVNLAKKLLASWNSFGI